MSICKTCGKEIPREARFCTYCGTLQKSPAPEKIVETSAPAEQPVSPMPKEAVEAETAPKTEAPKAEVPKAEAPKTEAPKAEAPKTEVSRAEAPKTEAPKAEVPKAQVPGAKAASAPLSAMPAYPQAPKAPAQKHPGDGEDCAPRYRPLGAWAYFWLSVLFSVPVVGFVFMIVFSCNGNNINRRNFARSYLIRLIFAIVLCGIAVLGCMLLANLFTDGDLSYWLAPHHLLRDFY